MRGREERPAERRRQKQREEQAALGIGAGPRFVWMGRLLDDDTKSLVEYGVENGQAIIVQGRPSPADLSD